MIYPASLAQNIVVHTVKCTLVITLRSHVLLEYCKACEIIFPIWSSYYMQDILA